jgi:phosphomannomutase
MAEMAAHVLQDEGMSPSLTPRSTPTPSLTHALAHGRYAAGLVATASHNPPADHGLKKIYRV